MIYIFNAICPENMIKLHKYENALTAGHTSKFPPQPLLGTGYSYHAYQEVLGLTIVGYVPPDGGFHF